MEIMKIYKVSVTEVYRKVVSVKALNEQDAQDRVLDAWKNTELILDMDNDFDGVEVYAIDEDREIDYNILEDKTVILGKGTLKNGK